MDLYIKDKEGITLHTEKKYCPENIKIGIETKELDIIPSLESQTYEGLYSKVNVREIEGEETSLIPSTETQTKAGIFTSVTIAGDSNLVAENIKKDVSIFGVIGEAELRGEENTVIDGSKYSSWTASSSTNYILNRMITKLPDDIDTSGWESLAYLFYYCISIETIPQLDTKNATKWTSMFRECSSLKTVPQLDASNALVLTSIFAGCTSLENLGGLVNLGKAYIKTQTDSAYTLNFGSSSNLTHESLMNVINGLYDLNLTYDVANGGTLYTQNLYLASTNLAKLTAEEIAIATAKRLVC